MINVTHIITDLDTGGAEMMLLKLLSQSNNTQFRHRVISLIDKGTLGASIEKMGVTLYTVDMARGRFPGFLTIFRLIRLIRKIDTDIIQGWMYHGNLSALVAKVFTVDRSKLIWNIRHPLNDLCQEKKHYISHKNQG